MFTVCLKTLKAPQGQYFTDRHFVDRHFADWKSMSCC